MTNTGVEDVPSELEEIPCPLCGTRPFHIYQTVRDRLDPSTARTKGQPQEKAYRIVACSSCGFLYLNPRPSLGELYKYYHTENYDPHRRQGGGIISSLFRFLRPFSIRWKSAKIRKDKLKGSLLDIGCGTGEFISHMKDRGWDVMGVEIDVKAAKVAQSAGCTILVGDPADVSLPGKGFDLITLWHALEHLPNLSGAVDNIASALKTGGRLAIAVPNPDSLDACFYGPRWAAWDAPRHLYHFCRRDLLKVMEPRGLHPVKSCSLPLDPFYHSLLSELSWAPGRASALKALRGLLIGGLSFITGLKPGKGSSIFYLFEKA